MFAYTIYTTHREAPFSFVVNEPMEVGAEFTHFKLDNAQDKDIRFSVKNEHLAAVLSEPVTEDELMDQLGKIANAEMADLVEADEQEEVAEAA